MAVLASLASALNRITRVAPMSSALPIQLADMRQSTTDNRSIDLTQALTPGDTVASITAITVVRFDGQTIVIPGPDLAISPDGFPAPSIVANWLGTAGLAINWYQSVGAVGNILYVISISFMTTSGVPLIYDASQYVTATLG